MAEENEDQKDVKLEGTFQLKDTSTSFFDDESGLEVTGDEIVKVGKNAGGKTMRMIASGGLVSVSEKPRQASGTEKHSTSASQTGDMPEAPAVEKENNTEAGADDDDLPEDFPGYRALSDARITKRSEVEALSDDDLQATKGIGPKTAGDIRAALKK